MEFRLNDDDLQPLVRRIVAEVIGTLPPLPTDRIGLTEVEAATACGVPRHVLRDARLRGEIEARKIGRKFVYSVAELRKFLAGEIPEAGRSAGSTRRRTTK